MQIWGLHLALTLGWMELILCRTMLGLLKMNPHLLLLFVLHLSMILLCKMMMILVKALLILLYWVLDHHLLCVVLLLYLSMMVYRKVLHHFSVKLLIRWISWSDLCMI